MPQYLGSSRCEVLNERGGPISNAVRIGDLRGRVSHGLSVFKGYVRVILLVVLQVFSC